MALSSSYPLWPQHPVSLEFPSICYPYLPCIWLFILFLNNQLLFLSSNCFPLQFFFFLSETLTSSASLLCTLGYIPLYTITYTLAHSPSSYPIPRLIPSLCTLSWSYLFLHLSKLCYSPPHLYLGLGLLLSLISIAPYLYSQLTPTP